jgi:iron complex outermembrane receptor protein
MSNIKTCIFPFIFFLATSAIAFAQTETETNNEAEAGNEEFFDFGEDSGLTIYSEKAKKTPVQPEQDVFGAHNIVSGEQIKEQGSQDLLDTLRNVPGVVVSKHNVIGANTATSLYIRGRGYSHPSLETVTSFDGVPRNGAVWGQSMADAFPVFAADSIEVFKSPQPSAFGTGFGLVNITPKYQKTEGQEFNAGFNAGSFGAFSENVSFGYKKGRYDIFAAQSWLTTSGHVYHSGAEQQSYYVNGGFWLHPNWNVRVLANYVTAWTDQPASSDYHGGVLQRYETESLLATATLTNNFEKASGYVKFYFDDMSFYILHENTADDWSKQPISTGGFKARETLMLWEGSEIIAGFDLDKARTANEDHNPTTLPDRPSVFTQFPDMTLYSPYLATAYTLGSKKSFYATAQAGARAYLHDRFENTFAPQAGLALGCNTLVLQFNYSLGVVYPPPSLLNALVYNSATSYSDDALKSVKPEIVHHYEAGISYSEPSLFNIGASFFFDDGRDRIVASRGGSLPVSASTMSYFKTYGLEASAGFQPVKNFNLFAGGTYMWVSSKDESGAEADKMPFTPNFSMSAGVKYNFLKYISLSADYQYLGGLYYGTLMFGAFNTTLIPLPDQHLLNARLSFGVTYPEWNIDEAEVFVSVSNILNRSYEYYPGYRMPGITVTAGVDFKFN